MSMITATAWVPRGFAAPIPTKYTFDEDEFQRIAELAKLQLDDANEDLEEARDEVAKPAGDETMVEDDGSDDDAPVKTTKSKGFVVANTLFLVFQLILVLVTKTMTLRNMTSSITMTM